MERKHNNTTEIFVIFFFHDNCRRRKLYYDAQLQKLDTHNKSLMKLRILLKSKIHFWLQAKVYKKYGTKKAKE